MFINIMLSMCLVLLCAGFIMCLFTTNPTFLIVWLVLLSMIMSVIFLINLSSWMTYAVILLFTGGMMVLFSYMLSLILSSKINFFSFYKLIFILWLGLFFWFTQPAILQNAISISSLYSENMNSILLLMAIYLLLILLSMVKMASSLSGPMKSFFTHEN